MELRSGASLVIRWPPQAFRDFPGPCSPRHTQTSGSLATAACRDFTEWWVCFDAATPASASHVAPCGACGGSSQKLPILHCDPCTLLLFSSHMFTNPAQPLEPNATVRWTSSGGGPARAWITATAVAALGVFGDEADAAVVTYQLTGPVQGATYDPALVGMPMFVQWSVDSTTVVDSSYQKSVQIIDFRYGVTGTSEQWAGTGGVFYFNAKHLGIGLSANQATYTQQGTFVTSQAYFSYSGSPVVTDWTADGLPAGFTFAFLDLVTTTPFMVFNSSSINRKLIYMNETPGVTFAMVPEPTTAALLGLGGLAALRRRKRSHD